MEWFDRIGIHYDIRTIQTYERVRYGEDLDECMDGWFKDEIKAIKKQFNKLEKIRNEDNVTGLKDNIKKIFRR
ncbi:hypothetical protein LC048_14255 [Mesobacillus subterraneus]|uniref:hypothetical protein n=1 Tax=Mesobacillus subterraneus TaxID=285983 RepID=UPI00273E9A17|nr:hypothetical protein [Mesobacillus subterraneus]WLR53684.1 hypothetical protein LC048_14255 [Mesobacillus subterraneus]